MSRYVVCAVLASALAWAQEKGNSQGTPPAGTTTTITLRPAGTVVQYSSADAIGTVTSNGKPVTVGRLELQRAVDGDGNPTSCKAAADYLSGTPIAVDDNGSAMFSLDTTVLGTFGYRIHYIPGEHIPGEQSYGTSFSPCADLTVTPPPCSGVQISAYLASGDGNPPAGTTQTWTVEIKVHACEDATGLKVQGGTNGWATNWVGTPSTGVFDVRFNNRNQVITWNMESLAADQDATLPLMVTGTIKPNTPSGTILRLLGPWSVTYSTDGGLTYQKSDYTGAVTVTVQ
jgi:hypothetical protein